MSEQPSPQLSSAKHWVLIPAAGVGARMAAGRPKQYLKLGEQTILEHTIAIFESLDWVAGVLVGVSAEDAYWPEIAKQYSAKVQSYHGGSERSDTVALGLEFIGNQASAEDWIWVHDAARPFVELADLEGLKTKLIRSLEGGAILAAPVVDTIKLAKCPSAEQTVPEVATTLERSLIWRALTPQVFRFNELQSALSDCAKAGITVTDEASAMEAQGFPVALVAGSARNIKITKPSDMDWASFMIKARAK